MERSGARITAGRNHGGCEPTQDPTVRSGMEPSTRTLTALLRVRVLALEKLAFRDKNDNFHSTEITVS